MLLSKNEQFCPLTAGLQEGRVAKRVVIGSYVAKMSSDFYLCTPDIWWPVIGQFSSGHSQTIDNSSPETVPFMYKILRTSLKAFFLFIA